MMPVIGARHQAWERVLFLLSTLPSVLDDWDISHVFFALKVSKVLKPQRRVVYIYIYSYIDRSSNVLMRNQLREVWPSHCMCYRQYSGYQGTTKNGSF